MNNLGILIMAALVVSATCVGMVWFVFRARQVAARANGMLESMNDDDLGAFRAQLAADEANHGDDRFGPVGTMNIGDDDFVNRDDFYNTGDHLPYGDDLDLRNPWNH